MFHYFYVKNLQLTFFIMTVLLIALSFTSYSQNNIIDDRPIFDAFKAYTKLPREICYTHLNKTTLIKGEDLGLTVYLFDKYTKKMSLTSTNVYCTIENQQGAIIKSGLLLATDGVASNVFEIDSLFTTGNYTFKAYTNWMKNFKEENFYVQDIKIIDPETNNETPKTALSSEIDIQFLPEGGHMVGNIPNNVGVIVKDKQGYGVKNLEGSIVDQNGNEVTNFKTNQFGIAKFFIIPDSNSQYKSIIRYENYTKEVVLIPAKKLGINLTLKDLGNRIIIKLNANQETFGKIKNNQYKLSIHNGSQLKVIDILFNESKELSLLIDNVNLYSGMNIITLFDHTNNPILERLFFNYDGVPILTSEKTINQRVNDTFLIKIPMPSVDTNSFNNFSVSVLPEATQSYNNHQNIISNIFLKPYVKGYIENSWYYFTDIDREKKYSLDLLLLTQGWSSYDWTYMFNHPPNATFEYETGISFEAKINRGTEKQFLISPLTHSGTLTIDVEENENSFKVKGLLPIENERLFITGIDNKGRSNKPSLYLQFTPSKFPSITNFSSALPLKELTYFESNTDEPLIYSNAQEIEELDMVVVNANKKIDKIEKIKRRHNGTVDILTDEMRASNIDFASYISSKGFGVYQNGMSLAVTNLRRTNLQQEPTSPLIYLDNMLLSDFSILVNYDMSRVDYVVIDKSGLGEGIRGANGVIKIFTNPQLIFKDDSGSTISQQYQIPLSFKKEKAFYIPLYASYQSDFFEHFGVIDWFPKLKVDSQGNLNFKIAAKKEHIKMYIEGVANDGSFISEVKTLNF